MKKIFFKVLILIILLMFLIINISIAVPGKLNDSNVRVRSEPTTTSSKVLTNLYLNDPVEVIEKTGDWYKIKTKSGIEGYVFAEYINVTGNVPILGDVAKPAPTEKPVKTDTKPAVKEPVKPVETLPTKKITKDLAGKYMPLMYSSNKVTYKKNENIKILDEKGLWTKVSNDKQESWVLTNKLI